MSRSWPFKGHDHASESEGGGSLFHAGVATVIDVGKLGSRRGIRCNQSSNVARFWSRLCLHAATLRSTARRPSVGSPLIIDS
jgi:hypothetical protein